MDPQLWNVCAVIPAKGYSRRVPNKNMRPLGRHGWPLFSHAVRACLGAGLTDVRVTSECDAVLDEAEGLGARAIRRPFALSGDNVPLEHVKAHALDALQPKTGDDLHAALMLLPTYPFRAAADIRCAVSMLGPGGIQEVRSAEMVERCGGLLLPNSWMVAYLTPRGRESTKPGLMTAGMHAGVWLRLDPIRAIDIDTEEDWARAERVYTRFNFTTGAITPEAQ